MIVDFEQDPDAPFGTGNFRDENGRMMYVNDPDTARQFTKTMRGSGTARTVADESTQIARGLMGNPSAGPDQRLASNDQKYQAAARGLAGGAPTATDAPAAGGAGAALVQKQTETDAALKTPPAPNPTAAGVGGTDPASLSVTPDEQAKLAAPAAPAAPGTGGAGARLVEQNDAAVADIHGDPRLQEPTSERLPERSTLGLPPGSVKQGENLAIAEGRPLENVVAQIGDEETAGKAGDAKIGQSFDARIAASDASYRARMANARAQYGANVNRVFEARAERQKAEAEQERLQKALEENDKKLDPDRVMRNMSTGKTLMMTILAALNGGFGAVIGRKDNDVLGAMNRAVDQDIDRQKQEVASGRVRIGNLIDKFMKEGFDAKTSEILARDKLDTNLAAFSELEAQRVGASADLRAQKDALLQQRLEARTLRRGELLKEAENKKQRALNAETEYAQPPLTPQAMLATVQLSNAQTEQANTKPVEAAVGHPVSPDEAKQIRNDSQDYGKRAANIASFKANIRSLAKTMGLSYEKGKGFTGDPKTGTKWLGVDAMRSEQRRHVDRQYGIVQRADTMQMVREPSAKLQDRFGEITDKPFWDSDIPTQLNDLWAWADQAEGELDGGFSDDARLYYKRGKTKAPPAPPPDRKAAAAKAAESTGGETIGTAPLPSTLDGQTNNKRPGGAEAY